VDDFFLKKNKFKKLQITYHSIVIITDRCLNGT
jgi:hypothetical protein